MTGLFERALDGQWTDLHPEIRERYGLVAADDRVAVGTGRMDRLARHPLALPALWLGTLDDFLFPEQGAAVPFTITTEAFVDEAGREALFLKREFETDPPRVFVDTLRWNPERECIADFFGHRGHVVADLHLHAAEGQLLLEIGQQWLRAGGRYVPLPGPLAAGGLLRDWYDDTAAQFHVAADITNPLLGTVFAYEGTFENELRPVEEMRGTESQLGGVPLPGARG